MTATRHWTIWCDYVGPHPSDAFYRYLEGGERCQEWTDHGESTAATTRRLAAMEGWAYRNRQDLCPRHARKEKP